MRFLARASRFLIGLVTWFTMHGGNPRRRARPHVPVAARGHADQLGEAGGECAQRPSFA